MNVADIQLLNKALTEHQAELQASNLKLFQVVRSIPIGREMLRRHLATLNLAPGAIDRLMKGEVLPQDAAALAGLNLGKS